MYTTIRITFLPKKREIQVGQPILNFPFNEKWSCRSYGNSIFKIRNDYSAISRSFGKLDDWVCEYGTFWGMKSFSAPGLL